MQFLGAKEMTLMLKVLDAFAENLGVVQSRHLRLTTYSYCCSEGWDALHRHQEYMWNTVICTETHIYIK